MRPLNKKQKIALFFLAKFLVIYLVLQFVLLQLPLQPLENGLAELEGNWLQIPVEGNRLFVSNGVFVVDTNCTGLVSGIILAAIVFSLQKPDWKKKVLLWFSGSVLMFVLNLFRLYVVLWTGKNVSVEAAQTVHWISWFSTGALIIVVWLLVSKRIARVNSIAELAG